MTDDLGGILVVRIGLIGVLLMAVVAGLARLETPEFAATVMVGGAAWVVLGILSFGDGGGNEPW